MHEVKSDEKIIQGFEVMFKGMESRKKRRKDDYRSEELSPSDHHRYFAVYRKEGHRTMRLQPLNKGEKGRRYSKLFFKVADPLCNYLMFYKIDAGSAEITAFDPTV